MQHKDGCPDCLSPWCYHSVDSWPERMDPASDRSRGERWGGKKEGESREEGRGGGKELTVFEALVKSSLLLLRLAVMLVSVT